MNEANRFVTGAEHCGPGNEVTSPDRDNPDDLACYEHDMSYGEMQRRGINPYFRFNEADERFLRSGANPIWKLPFRIKKAMSWNEDYKDVLKRKKSGRVRKKAKWARRRAKSKGIGYIPPDPLPVDDPLYWGSFKKPPLFKMAKYRRRRFGRRRPFRRYRRYRRRGNVKRLANALSSKLLPTRVLKGISHWSMICDANRAMWVAAGAVATGYAPYSYSRYANVGAALTNSTTSTGFDDEYTFRWPLSRTVYSVHNPNNFPLRGQFYTYRKYKQNANSNTLLNQFDQVTGNTSVFVNTAGIGVTPAHSLTVAAPASSLAPMDKWLTNLALQMSDISYSRRDFKISRCKYFTLPPMGYAKFVIAVRMRRKLTGQEFDINETQPFSRMPLWRFESYHLNTDTNVTDAEKLECGQPAFGVSFKASLVDVCMEYPSDAQTQRFVVDQSVETDIINASGTSYTVASTVGATNVAADAS